MVTPWVKQARYPLVALPKRTTLAGPERPVAHGKGHHRSRSDPPDNYIVSRGCTFLWPRASAAASLGGTVQEARGRPAGASLFPFAWSDRFIQRDGGGRAMVAFFGPSQQELERLRSTVQSLGTTSVPGLAAALSVRERKAEKLLAHELARPDSPIVYEPSRRLVRWAVLAPTPPATDAPDERASAPRAPTRSAGPFARVHAGRSQDALPSLSCRLAVDGHREPRGLPAVRAALLDPGGTGRGADTSHGSTSSPHGRKLRVDQPRRPALAGDVRRLRQRETDPLPEMPDPSTSPGSERGTSARAAARASASRRPWSRGLLPVPARRPSPW